MKNKEKYLDDILAVFSAESGSSDGNCDFRLKHVLEKGECTRILCEDCDKRVKGWLEEEHIETIKLKRWEYDLLKTNSWPHYEQFDSFYTYKTMKSKGHFKGVTDTSMTIKQILGNCEVVE